MRWFQKDHPPGVWEFADQPLGDTGAAQKIREICASAGSIAETLAALRGARLTAKGPRTPYSSNILLMAGWFSWIRRLSETERYQAAAKCALELAKTNFRRCDARRFGEPDYRPVGQGRAHADGEGTAARHPV